MGRRTKYKDTFPILAEKYALEGMIDEEIAKKLGISIGTFYEYRNKYPEFSESIDKGKIPTDDKVEDALLKRCLGFEYEETQVEYIPGKAEAEGEEPGPAIPVNIKRTKKTVLGSVRAEEFWLQNRRPEKWRNLKDVKISGTIGLSMSELKKSIKDFEDKSEPEDQCEPEE